MVKPGLSLTVPVYNEEERLKKIIPILIKNFTKFIPNFEIILVENGSTDKSPKIVDSLARRFKRIRVIHLPKADYGSAVRTGYLKSSKGILANFSADWIDITFLKKALREIDGYSIIIATKNNPRSVNRRPFIRKYGGLLYAKLIKILFGLPVTDTHGIKVLKKSDVLKIIKSCKFRGEEFDTELVLRSVKASLSILEIPVSIKEIRPPRQNIVKRAIRGLYQLLVLRFLW